VLHHLFFLACSNHRAEPYHVAIRLEAEIAPQIQQDLFAFGGRFSWQDAAECPTLRL
jgi:hypothetical protein